MDQDQLNEIALELEAEELIGANGRRLESDDILPVLELLWDRRVNVIDAFEITDPGDFSAAVE